MTRAMRRSTASSSIGRRRRPSVSTVARTRRARTTRPGPRRGTRSRADPATTTADPMNDRGGLRRRISRVLYQRPRVRLALLLGGPIVWLLVAYIGSLVALLVTSVYHYESDPTGLVQ